MNDDVLTLFRNGGTQTRNPKCTVNNHFYETYSVCIYIYIYIDKDFFNFIFNLMMWILHEKLHFICK